MKKQVLQIVLYFGFFLLFSRCAQVVPLTGGQRDTTPPKLMESAPANKTLNFNYSEIVLNFDEYVQVRDLPNQLLVSPKLKTIPDVSSQGKKIIVKLDPKELLPNTTYRFSFGKAISDMNESNSIDNFEYIFSTGPVIDTLSVSGVISEAANNRPAANVLVGLYLQNRNTDSLPYLVTPDYVARSNDNGSFSFSNLPARSYQVYAINDINKNNLYDGVSEKVAFLESDLQLKSDSNISLIMFQEEAAKVFIKKTFSPFYGLTQIIFNKKTRVKVTGFDPLTNSNISETAQDKERDTVSVYYRNITDSLQLKVQNIALGSIDTLKIILPPPNKSKKTFIGLKTNFSGGHLPLNEKLRFSFSNWMDTTKVDLQKLKLSSVEDTLVSKMALSGHWTGITTFELNNKLREGTAYQLKLDSGAFNSVHKITNDSLRLDFKTRNRLEFGKVTLKISLNRKQNYLIQLINEQLNVVQEKPLSFSLSSSNTASIDFTDLAPGTYQVKIIFDDNNNQKWDTGNFLLKKQPERVIINSKQLKILADWEIEEEILEKDSK